MNTLNSGSLAQQLPFVALKVSYIRVCTSLSDGIVPFENNNVCFARIRATTISLHHDFQNLHVGLLHAVAAEAADVVDGLFDVLTDDTIAAKEVAALLAHLVT